MKVSILSVENVSGKCTVTIDRGNGNESLTVKNKEDLIVQLKATRESESDAAVLKAMVGQSFEL